MLGETLKWVKHRGSTLIAPYRVFPVLPQCYHRFSNSGRAARWSTLHAARSSARGAAVAAAASRHILILVHGLINVLVLGLLGERVDGQRRGAVGSILRAGGKKNRNWGNFASRGALVSARGAAVAAAVSTHILIRELRFINVSVLGLLGECVGGWRRRAVGGMLHKKKSWR